MLLAVHQVLRSTEAVRNQAGIIHACGRAAVYKSYQHTSIKLRQVVYTCIVHVQNSSIDIYSRRAINNKQVHPHRYLLLLLLLLLLQLHTAASTAYCCYGYVFVSHLPLICATIRAPINRHTRSRTIDRPFDFRCSIESRSLGPDNLDWALPHCQYIKCYVPSKISTEAKFVNGSAKKVRTSNIPAVMFLCWSL